MDLWKVFSKNRASWQQSFLWIIRRILEYSPRKEIGMTFANPCIIQIIRGDSQNIGNIHIVYPVLELFHPEEEIFHVLNTRNVRTSSWRACHCHRHPSAKESTDL